MDLRSHPVAVSMRHQISSRPDRYLNLLVGLLYVLITIWMTWPLPKLAGSALQDLGDPLFEIWVMRAVQHGLVTDPLNLYHANAFYPFEYSLAYSEEAISTAILGWPVQILTGNDILAYNIVLLGSFWLVGFGVYLLARELGAQPGAAFLAGVLAAFAPARYAQLYHLHMLVIGMLPFVLWALTLYVRGGQRRYLLVLGGALTVQLFGSLHLAVYTTLVLALYLPFLVIFERKQREWTRGETGQLALALGVPYLLFAPTLLPHIAAGEQYGFARSRDEILRYSATLKNYLMVSTTNRFWPGWMERSHWALFPGAVALVGAALGLVLVRKWVVLFAATLTLVAGVLSLGLALDVAGRSIPMPYRLLYDLVPAFQNIRVVSRYGLLTAIGIPLLAAFGYSAGWQRLRPRFGRHALPAGIALTAALTLVACIELRAVPRTMHVDTSAEAMAVYEVLATLPPGPVIEFPAHGVLDRHPPPDGIFQPVRYMYGSTRHWLPLVNGYSGYFPRQHIELLRLFETVDHPSMVTSGTVGVLADLEVRYVVIHPSDRYDQALAFATASAIPELEQVVEVNGSVIYEVVVGQRQQVAASISLPAGATAGLTLPVRFHWDNPNDNLALAHLEREPEVTFTWLDADSNVLQENRRLLRIGIAVAPGETVVTVEPPVPNTLGSFTLRITVTGDIVLPFEQQVHIVPAS